MRHGWFWWAAVALLGAGCQTAMEGQRQGKPGDAPRSKVGIGRAMGAPRVMAVLPESAEAVRKGAPKGWGEIHAGMSQQEVHDRIGVPWRTGPGGRVELWCQRAGDYVWNLQVIYAAPGKVEIVRSFPARAVSAEAFAPKQREIVPEAVIEEVQAQIKAYLGESDFKGVPLLDPSVDWDDFRNWPEKLAFGGETYRLQVVEMDGDVETEVPSRAELAEGSGFIGRYKSENGEASTGPMCIWSEPGVVRENGFWIGPERTVFGMQYGSGGKLVEFDRTDFGSGERYVDVYDRWGKWVGAGRGKAYWWRNREVKEEEFFRLKGRRG